MIFSNLMFVYKVICCEILSVCLGAENSFYDKYKDWLASALSQVTTVSSVHTTSECETGWVVSAAFVYRCVFVIIQSQ